MFFKECKKIIFSATFLLYVFVVFAMYLTQFSGDVSFEAPPRLGGDFYGYTEKPIPETLMPNATKDLLINYLSGEFTTYPIGFYKNVKLTESKKAQLAEVLSELTGLSAETVKSLADGGFDAGGFDLEDLGDGVFVPAPREAVLPEYEIPETLTYERFSELMTAADKIIGGGSSYSEKNISGFYSRVPKTYEDAKEEYDKFINEEKITGAYARLFCDYSGIDLAVMPVFAAAALAALDKKSRISDLIYSRKISSARLIFTRYAALLATLLIPVLITVVHANISIAECYPDNTVDMLAIPKLAAVWLIPNVMLAAAVGMLVTEISSPVFAVFIQGAWWIASVFAAGGLHGEIGNFTLVCRHNTIYGAEAFAATLPQFYFNRAFFAVLSIVLTALAAVVYELKRRGIFGGLFTSYKNNIGKSKA